MRQRPAFLCAVRWRNTCDADIEDVAGSERGAEQKPAFLSHVVDRFEIRFAGIPAELVEDVAGLMCEAGEAAIHKPKSVVHDDFLVRAWSVTQSLTSEVSHRYSVPI